MDFKPGDRIRCIDAEGTELRQKLGRSRGFSGRTEEARAFFTAQSSAQPATSSQPG
jgi:hypothetical protein